MGDDVLVTCRRARWAAVISLSLLVLSAIGHGETASRMDLRENWYIQSSCKIRQPGEVLSTLRFSPAQWYKTTIPSTVLAAQVADGELHDIYFGKNLRKLPGMDSGKVSANSPMPSGSPYACPWWYRTEFRLPKEFRNRRIWLRFDGINYKANVWLNGKKLADAKDVAGTYRIFELDATALIDRDGMNVLAVEVFAPTDKDLAMTFVDWNPTPPDKDMGLWRSVYLLSSGPVRVRYPMVVTHFPRESLDRADLTVRAELHNDTDSPVEGTIRGGFDTVTFEKKIVLSPRETRAVTFTPNEFPQLKIDHPELWWPTGLGAQKLHMLTVSFVESSGNVSDSQSASFGIREITGELYGPSPRPGELFNNNVPSGESKTDLRPLLIRVNHRPVLIRGAGWTPEMLLRSSPDRLKAELGYVRDMHLNAVRLEGKLESDDFYNLTDRLGILVLAGWCCCDHWQHWNEWKPGDLTIATDSLRTQILRMRSHASMALWMNGSDVPPPPAVEEAYRKVLAETGWPNPYISSASSTPTTVTGASGVKMTGPYDYEPPDYWLNDHKFGGAFGFNTETSPGAAIPVKSSLQKFLGEDHLWPIDDVWKFHTGAGELDDNLDLYNESMNAIYGPPKGLDDYLRKAQAMDYDGERAMFEAFGRNKYEATGVIQWMLNNAWPSLIWHLYDYYLQPAGGYFGTKKACEPAHIQYSYDDRSVVVVNSANEDFDQLTAEISMYDFNLRRLFFRKVQLASPTDSVQRLLKLPSDNIDSNVYFVRLMLLDKDRHVVSTNFYWLPKKLSTVDESLQDQRKHPYYESVTSYEDLSMLNQLKKVHVDATASLEQPGDGTAVRVLVHNPSANLAFLVQLAVVDDKTGEEILPVLWDDNYFSLMPGESRTVSARFSSAAAVGRVRLEVKGWNIDPETAVVGRGK